MGLCYCIGKYCKAKPRCHISAHLCFVTFIIIQGSPDLVAASEVADYLGTRHHEFHFTVQVIAFSGTN